MPNPVKMQRKDIKFWICGPTTIWHNIQSVAIFSKSLHPAVQELHFAVLYVQATEKMRWIEIHNNIFCCGNFKYILIKLYSVLVCSTTIKTKNNKDKQMFNKY